MKMRHLPPRTRVRWNAAHAIAAALVGLLPAVGHAQQVPDTAALSPVIVTATKIPPGTGSSTASTTVLDGAALRAKGIVTVADALREVPGIVVGQSSGAGSQTALFMRGGNSNFTKVLIDGVPVNAPGGALDLSTLTVDNVERIEIVRGPASVQYGSDAVTGVVQIFTRRREGAMLEARVADRDGTLDANAEVARARSLGMTGSRVRFGVGSGYHRTNGFLPFNNDYLNRSASALVAIEGVRSHAALSASFVSARYEYPTDGSGNPVDSNAFNDTERLVVSLSGTWRPNGPVGVRTQLGLAETKNVYEDLADGPADTVGFYYHYRTAMTGWRRTADVQLYATLPAKTTATVGAAVEGQTLHSRNSYETGFGPGSGEGGGSALSLTRTNRAVYAQLAGRMRRLSFDAGVRREQFENANSIITGRGGLAIELLPGSVVRGSLATAYKEPSIDEEVLNSLITFVPGGVKPPVPRLQAERNRSREIGAETRLPGGRMTVGATYFEQHFEDMVQYQDNFPAPGYFVNVADARSRGWELEARIAERRHLTFRGSYTILRTEVTDRGPSTLLENGKPLLRRPRQSASADIGLRRARLTAHAIVMRVGARDDTDFSAFPFARVRLDAYTRVDLSAEVRLRSVRTAPDAALTLRADNVTNAEYRNVAGFRTPGRVLFLGARLGR